MTNKELHANLQFLHSIAPQCKGKIGYAVARNIRKISEELTEYSRIRNEKIMEYSPDGVLTPDDANFDAYIADMSELDNIDHAMPIYKIADSDLISTDLSADIMLALSFMTEEVD